MQVYRALPFLVAYMGPATVVAGYLIGGWGTFLTLFYSYIIVPPLDQALGTHFNQSRPKTRSRVHDLVLWLSVPVLFALLGWALWTVTHVPMTTVEVIGFTISVGFATGGLGITAAHELVHRRSALERGLGLALLAIVANMQFRIEHVHGHHRFVATPRDPATARLGESLSAFFPRSLIGQHVSAFGIEAERLARRGRARYGLGNRMVWYMVVEIAIFAGVFAVFGWKGLAFFAAQCLVALFLLESVNYIEHYGLLRRKNAKGTYEKVGPQHSWNSNHRLTNWTLFNLGKHSDHHTNEVIHYEGLGDSRATPQMPGGYATMIVLAMIPPVWRRVMDPRVANLQAA